MRYSRKLFVTLFLVFFAIQLIQPAHNKSGQGSSIDLALLFAVPNKVQTILHNACYDCHSNNTSYPWYSNIQPMAWVIARSIKNGKDKLNFSDFCSYTSRSQISKLKGISNQIKEMKCQYLPTKGCTKNANLTKEEKVLIMDWMNKTTYSLSASN